MPRHSANTALFCSFIALSSLLPSSVAQPSGSEHRFQRQRPNCRCSVVPHSDSAFAVTDSHNVQPTSSECDNVASQLEALRERDEHSWQSLLSEGTLDSDDLLDSVGRTSLHALAALKPSEAEIASIASRRKSKDGLVVCKPMDWSGSTAAREYIEDTSDKSKSRRGSYATFVLGGVVVLLIVGLLAEVVEKVLFRSSLFRQHQPVILTGDERILSADEEQSVFGAYPENQIESDDDWIAEKPII